MCALFNREIVGQKYEFMYGQAFSGALYANIREQQRSRCEDMLVGDTHHKSQNFN